MRTSIFRHVHLAPNSPPGQTLLTLGSFSAVKLLNMSSPSIVLNDLGEQLFGFRAMELGLVCDQSTIDISGVKTLDGLSLIGARRSVKRRTIWSDIAIQKP